MTIKQGGISVEPLTIDMMLYCSQMQDDFHGDPADRMIVSTARVINALLMTADKKIMQYCRKYRLPVHAV